MMTICQAEITGIFVAKTVRTFCYGFLGIALPVYLTELGLTAAGLGVAITLTLAGSALLTWLVRRPAERYGGRPALITLGALSALAALILLSSRDPRLVVLAAMLGNVAVGTGETGPFLALEQVRIARAVAAGQRTAALSIYNLLGYAAAASGRPRWAHSPGTDRCSSCSSPAPWSSAWRTRAFPPRRRWSAGGPSERACRRRPSSAASPRSGRSTRSPAASCSSRWSSTSSTNATPSVSRPSAGSSSPRKSSRPPR